MEQVQSNPIQTNNPTKNLHKTKEVEIERPTYFFCPLCYAIPYILMNDDMTINIKCTCSYKATFTIEKYFDKIKKEKNQSCSMKKLHDENTKAIGFCTDCDLWLCPLCHSKHIEQSPDHIILMTSGTKLKSKCEYKKCRRLIEMFCKTCRIHICKQCKRNHKGHDVIDLIYMFKENDIMNVVIPILNEKNIEMNKYQDIPDSPAYDINLVIEFFNSIIGAYMKTKEVVNYHSRLNLIDNDINKIFGLAYRKYFSYFKAEYFIKEDDEETSDKKPFNIFYSEQKVLNKNNCIMMIDGNNVEFTNEFNMKKLSVGNHIVEITIKRNQVIEDMRFLFRFCSSLVSVDLSRYNTSRVLSMESAFSFCSSLVTVDLSNVDTSNVSSMSNMFCNCTSLVSLDLSNFNTKKVLNMQYMFYYCSSLVSLDISNFTTISGCNMKYMFGNCTSLSKLNVSPSFKLDKLDGSSKKSLPSDCFVF